MHDLSPEHAQLDEICDAFERCVREGKNPDLVDFLLRMPASQRDLGLLELIKVEVELRRDSGDCPSPEAYFGRFSDNAQVVKAAFEAIGQVAPRVASPESTVPFDRIQSTCLRFQRDWEAIHKPGLPSYLVEHPEDVQAPLLRNLLDYEIRKRKSIGESPSVQEYLECLPEHAAVIRSVFLEASRASFNNVPDQSTCVWPEEGIAVASRLGDYRLVGELGRGGMGAVYAAVHVVKGNKVALKTLPTVTPEALHRFKREFRLVADVTHPNLVSLHSLESDGGQYFITMDLVVGVDFQSWVCPQGRLNESRLRAALGQLVAAIVKLHASGVVHRDLKPQNVLVTAEGRVIVLDFGLAAEAVAGPNTTAMIAGTPQYMAPEQATGLAVGPPADWYAVGVMLYEALSGQWPFYSHDWAALLKQKQEKTAPPLPKNKEYPSDIADLCMDLLARDPHARPDPIAIIGVAKAAGEAAPAIVDNRCQLIAREEQLRALAESRETLVLIGEPVCTWVRGRSGEGKTTLVERFLTGIEPGSAVVLSGRCYDRESVPFKALDTLVDALASYLRSLPNDRCAQLLPDDISILAQLFPQLNRCEMVATAPRGRTDSIDQQQMRARAFVALRLLLDRVSQATPVVAFIDDLQWGDQDSARALFEVLRPPAGPRVLLLGSYRSDEADSSPFLREWLGLRKSLNEVLNETEVRVGPLTLEQSTELVVQLLGAENDIVLMRAAQFHAQADGNPFLLTELAECFDPELDAFNATDIHGVLQQKLQKLPVEAKRVLEVVAVSGQSLDADEATTTAGSSTTIDNTLIRMRNARLLRLVGDKLDTYHDRIRYVVADKLEPDVRRGLHARLAGVIEQKTGGLLDSEVAALGSTGELPQPRILDRAFDLAFHWDASGQSSRALAYGLAAAAQARKQYALEVAAEQFAIAERNAADSPKLVRLRIARGHGEALLQLGRYEECAGELAKAADLAEASFDTADVKGLQGELASKLGHVNASMELLEDALRGLGLRVPKSSLGFFWDSVKQGSVHLTHLCAPGLLHRQQSNKAADLANHLLARLEYDYYAHNLPRLFWGSLVGLNRAERLPPSPALSFQYVCHANDLAVIGWHSRAKVFYNVAIKLSEELNDQWGAALALNHFALGCMGAARYEEAIEKATPGKEVFRRLGDLFEVHMASFFIGVSHHGLGNIPEAISEARWMFESCVQHGDNMLGPVALSLWSRAAQGDLPLEDLVCCVKVSPGHNLGLSSVAMAEGYWHLRHDRTEDAMRSFELGWKTCRDNVYLTPFNSWILVECVSALRRHAEALETQGTSGAVGVRRRWVKLAFWANWLSRLDPQTRSHALRELSLVYSHRGRIAKAWKTAGKSWQVAQSQRAKLESARSLLVQGQLAERLGRPEAREQTLVAERELSRICLYRSRT